jgi:tellurite resistance protein TerC
MKTRFTITYKLARRFVVGVVGASVLLIGVALLVLPGPAVVVIPLGLGILGLEFAWARRWLRTFRNTVGATARSAFGAAPAPQPAERPRAGKLDRPGD